MTTPAQTSREKEKRRVRRLAAIADILHGDRWMIDVDQRHTNIISKRPSGERAVLCTIYPEAMPEEIELLCGALENLVLLLDIRRRAIIALKSEQTSVPQEPQTREQLRDGNFAANAAMLCAEPLFHRFLERKSTGGAIHTKDHAEAALKKLLGITSKTQLNKEQRAQTAFLDLRSDFDVWKSGRG